MKIHNLKELQQTALTLWKADKQSAKELGAALVKVRKAMPHGEFGTWLKKNGIDRNRATYTMRVATGKAEKPKKKPKEYKDPGSFKKAAAALRVARVYGPNALIVMLPVKLQDDFRHIATAKGRTTDELLTDIISGYVAVNEDQIQIGKVKGDAKTLASARMPVRTKGQEQQAEESWRRYREEQKQQALEKWTNILRSNPMPVRPDQYIADMMHACGFEVPGLCIPKKIRKPKTTNALRKAAAAQVRRAKRQQRALLRYAKALKTLPVQLVAPTIEPVAAAATAGS